MPPDSHMANRHRIEKENSERSQKRPTEVGEKKNRTEGAKVGGREGGRIWNITVIWNQAWENSFCATSVTGCTKSSLGLHYKVKTPTRLA